MTRLGRRDFLKGAVAGSAALALGFPNIARGAKPYAGQALSVFSYAGAYESTLRKFLVPRFEERTGARVKLDVGWWDMLPKLKASPPGQPVYDVVLTDPTQGFPSIKEGLFQKINLEHIPNAKLLAERFQRDWIQADGWGVNLTGSLMVMTFHTELVKNIPQHWHELHAPEFKGKLSMYDAPYQSLFAFAQMKAGKEGRPGKGYEELKKDLDAVLKFCADNRDIVRLWWTSTGDFMGKLLQKEIVGGVSHSTGPFAAEDEGKPLKSVVPQEGAAIVQVFWLVTAGTKVKRLAEEWINDFCDTEFQVKWGTVGKIAVPNLAGAAIAAKEDRFYGKFLPKSEADWNRIVYYPYDIYFDGNNWARINDFWEREVLRKKRG